MMKKVNQRKEVTIKVFLSSNLIVIKSLILLKMLREDQYLDIQKKVNLFILTMIKESQFILLLQEQSKEKLLH
jgi:hypothetical protein